MSKEEIDILIILITILLHQAYKVEKMLSFNKLLTKLSKLFGH